jgi:hypothetical protein
MTSSPSWPWMVLLSFSVVMVSPPAVPVFSPSLSSPKMRLLLAPPSMMSAPPPP